MKIKNRNEIAEVAERLRKEGKKIVTCNGAFDILHLGHIKFLEEAKAQGDVLIVGLNSDSSIKQYKGKDRPVNDQYCRSNLIAALEMVDYVTIFEEADPRALLEAIKPDVHCNGIEYGENCIEAETVRKYGGKIHLIKNYKGISTTKIISRIMDVYGTAK
ncbi:MAG TPA: adenylyltransferase/cytidyltransferase family protein [Candidatus Nanoarchaeia archaeon]|nr:adenylyltransferase/cytidyltransferase family protein [Candidatus Nanoarchaeia archaeon]